MRNDRTGEQKTSNFYQMMRFNRKNKIFENKYFKKYIYSSSKEYFFFNFTVFKHR